MARYLNTPEARAIGEAVLDLTMPGAVAFAQDAQEDGFDSETKKEFLPVSDGERDDGLHARDFQADPVDIGNELQRALEALGWKLERV